MVNFMEHHGDRYISMRLVPPYGDSRGRPKRRRALAMGPCDCGPSSATDPNRTGEPCGTAEGPEGVW